jgi:tRNA(fMet)-specific endonuclease VapC
MYLFDTDVLSNVVKTAPSPALMKKLGDIPRDMQFTTTINVGEVYYGASRTARREEILQAFDKKVFPSLNILPFDVESAKIHGQLKARLEKRGLSKSEPDLRIASIALQNKFTLVTDNEAHFTDIPRLKVENWLK